ncbi:MAG: branched-chain amino acid ABC transporter permease [Ilumatobacter sp.]|nr:branched-chain amino acid ABC transporter permease [Ilumatobacter sp.]
MATPTAAARPGTTPSRSPRDIATFALILALLVLYPFIDQALGLRLMGALLPIGIYALLAMGLNIVVGYAGLLDLGYAAFFAIGAYTIGFLTSPGSVMVRNGWIPPFFQNFWPALVVSFIVAAIFGVLLGAPTLRLRGDYLAIVTLGFGEIVPNFFLNATPLTNGTAGMNPIAKPPSLGPLNFGQTDQRNWYWLILAVGLFSLFLIIRLYDSRLGRSWQAIREDELAASAMGINLVRTKLWAFALGASFSGFAGSLFSSAFQYVHPSQFEFTLSIMILSAVILGGIGNVYGAIFGAFLIGSFDRILADRLTGPLNAFGEQIGNDWLANHNVGEDRYLVFGLALVLMMVLRPGGLFPSRQRAAEMQPEDEDISIQEQQDSYDIRTHSDPTPDEQGGKVQ